MKIQISKIEKQAIDDLKKNLASKFDNNLVAIKLFGSRARGDASTESDIDILLIVKKRTKFFDNLVIRIVCNILNKYGVYIETITMTEQVYKNARRLQYPFVQNIDKDAVNL